MTIITLTNSKALSTYLKRYKILVFTLLTPIAIASSLIAIKFTTGIAIDHLTRDPLAIANRPFYTGAFSNLGILFWCAAMAICLFTGTFLKQRCNNYISSFLLSSGVVTSILMFDDLFLLHEEVIPRYTPIKESFVYLLYLIIVISYLIKYRKIIAKTYLIPLQMSMGFLGISMLWDKLAVYIPVGQMLIEDTLKLSGIISWLVYFTLVAIQQLELVTNKPINMVK